MHQIVALQGGYVSDCFSAGRSDFLESPLVAKAQTVQSITYCATEVFILLSLSIDTMGGNCCY